MSHRVFVHVGLPKTGTTYLQSIGWANRDRLRERGLLLPGFGPRQHLWASCVVREERRIERRHADAPMAWDRLTHQLREWPETGLISHEFFSGASREQAQRAVDDLAAGGAEVHVVVTAREIVGLVTARWQEWIKNGATGEIDQYPADREHRPEDEWGWGTLDLAGVLDRWGSHVPPDRVHLICPPAADAPADELWSRFAGLLGVESGEIDLSAAVANSSLGVVEVELLRRINPHLSGFRRPVDRGRWVRGHLAQDRLVPRGGERFWPSAERVAALRERGEAGLVGIAEAGYNVIGSLETLRTPDPLPQRRHPDSVTDAEIADAGVLLAADLLADVREATQRAPGVGHAQPDGVDVTAASRVRGVLGRIRGRS